MPPKLGTLPKAVFILGTACLVWILYDLWIIHSDLKSVIFLETSGWVVGVGYLFIVLFHVLMLIIYWKYFRHHQNMRLRIIPVFLWVLSLFALAVEKAMFDEVRREYYLEFPAPGEVGFIYLGLFFNAVFIAYALYCIAWGLNLGLKNRLAP